MNAAKAIQRMSGVAVLGSLAAMTACRQVQSSPKTLRPVRTATVQLVTVGNGVRYSADIVPYSQVGLAFKSNGYVDSVLQVKSPRGGMRNVDQGDWVKKDTVLATVHQQDYLDKLDQAKAEASRAQAEYEKAKLGFDRTSALYGTQSATKPDYDSAKAQLESTTAGVAGSKAQVSQAQVALDYCFLRAPFSGWIIDRSIDVGSLVGPATTGFTIADTRSVKAVFGVPDISFARVRLGQHLPITTDAVPGQFPGRVTAISPAADPKSRVFAVEVTIENPNDRLKSGMIASVVLGGKELARPVTTVPLAAIVSNPQQPNGFAVMVLEEAETADAASVHLRPVDVGEAYGNSIAISSGLNQGEKVVTTGATLVKNGERVRIIP